MLENTQIQQIAKLAKLKIKTTNSSVIADELSSILELVSQLQDIITDDVLPMANPHDGVARLRNDEVTQNNNRDTYQTVAPATQEGYYLVPKVL